VKNNSLHSEDSPARGVGTAGGLKKYSIIFRFAFLAIVFCSLLEAYSCRSLVIKEKDSASDKTGKVFGRILLGVGTLGLSENAIEDYTKEYKREKQSGAVLRNHSMYTLQAIADIGKAEREISLMIREKNPERIKYHLVMANNLLDNAVDKMSGLQKNKEQKNVAKGFKSSIKNIVDMKKQLIKYLVNREHRAAVAYQTLANQKIVEVLDRILQLSISNKYVFSQDEVYEIIALRQKWEQSVKTKVPFQSPPKQTF